MLIITSSWFSALMSLLIVLILLIVTHQTMMNMQCADKQFDKCELSPTHQTVA